MSEKPKRVYVPSRKHKYPKGGGSLCPRALEVHDAQALLERAVDVGASPDAPTGALWAVDGAWCFCAMPTHPNSEHEEYRHQWHGHPRIGGEVPDGVLRHLAAEGHITRRQLKRLRRQRALPSEWPA